ADCTGGAACTGNAQIALGDGGVGAAVKNCVAPPHADAGAPPTPTTVDAGPPKPAPVDAGGGGGGGGGGPIVVDPAANGTCPAGYKPVDYEKKCHRNCNKNEDCGAGAICTRGKFCKAGP